MSKLLARAKVALKNAEYDYKHMGEDDAWVDACCYHLQQAIEMALKYSVEIHGESYVENHDIRTNLNKLNRMNVEIPNDRRLRDMANTINSREAESRYFDSFVATKSDVDEALAMAKTLIDCVDSMLEIDTDNDFGLSNLDTDTDM